MQGYVISLGYKIQSSKMRTLPTDSLQEKFKCLQLGVVIGVVVTCCSVIFTFFNGHFTLQAPSDPNVPRYNR